MGRLAPARPLPEPPGRLVDGLGRAPRRAGHLLGGLPRAGAPGRRPRLGVGVGRPGRDGPPAAARGVPPGRRQSRRRVRQTLRRLSATEATPGRPRASVTDLTWFTDGVPYHYNVTTRYEIPCTVRGTVTIDGETLEVDGHGSTGPLLGRARLVGLRLVLVLAAARRRHPGPPGRHQGPGHADVLRLRPDARTRSPR